MWKSIYTYILYIYMCIILQKNCLHYLFLFIYVIYFYVYLYIYNIIKALLLLSECEST